MPPPQRTLLVMILLRSAYMWWAAGIFRFPPFFFPLCPSPCPADNSISTHTPILPWPRRCMQRSQRSMRYISAVTC